MTKKVINNNIKGRVLKGKIIKISVDTMYQCFSQNNDFYDQIIKYFGCKTQCVVAIEELSELQKEICKHLRGLGNVHHIAEEIADVQIMLEQLQRIFDCHSEVELMKKQKIQRTTERYLKK